MGKYCTRCHDSFEGRRGAYGRAANHDFNTLGGVLAMAEHIDIASAAGPKATNTVMPPDGDMPSETETPARRMVGVRAREVNVGSSSALHIYYHI